MTPDNKKVLLGFSNNTLKLIDLETQECLKDVTIPAPIRRLKITPDGQKVIFVPRDDTTFVIWNLETGQLEARKLVDMSFITCLEITSDGKRAFIGCSRGMLREWDLEKNICLQTRSTYDNPSASSSCAHLQVASDGTRVISANEKGLLKLWEFHSLPEELITAMARIEIKPDCSSRKLTPLLSQFAFKKINAMHDFFYIEDSRNRAPMIQSFSAYQISQDIVASQKRALVQSLDIYNATKALPEIQASLERAKSEPIFLAESIRRVAYLQHNIQTTIYRYLDEVKHLNGTLPWEIVHDHPVVAALFFEHEASIDERIEAIIKTIEWYEKNAPHGMLRRGL
jgi:hypothetical protein